MSAISRLREVYVQLEAMHESGDVGGVLAEVLEDIRILKVEIGDAPAKLTEVYVSVNHWSDEDSLDCPYCHRELCSVNGRTLGELLTIARKHVDEAHP